MYALTRGAYRRRADVLRPASLPDCLAPAGTFWRADVAPSAPTFTEDDPDMDADLALAGASHFYAVAPMDASDEPIGSANRPAAFLYSLVPGSGQ